VGFNPFRKRVRHRGSDIALLVLALAIVTGLLVWAAYPR